MSSRARVDRPVFLIIAGPNGSGKSSTYETSDLEADGRTVWIINPDLLTARIRDVEKLDLQTANLAAVQRIERWLEASIDAHQTIGVETVLSTDKYRRLVEQAKRRGFEFRFMFVVLDTPARNIERVRLRVSKGGHDVQEDKIIARFSRSLAQMPWFLAQADLAWLFDNSGVAPQLIGTKVDGLVTIAPSAPTVLRQAIEIGS